MKNLFLFALLLMSLSLSAQTRNQYSSKNKRAISAFRIGENNYMYEKYQAAVLNFEDAVREDPRFVEPLFMLSEIYREWGNHQRTFEYISRAVALDSTMFVAGYYHAGVALCHLQRFDEAMHWFGLYKRFAQGKRQKYDPQEWINKALVAKELIQNPVPFNPLPISEAAQLPYDMYWPSLTLDGNQMCLTVLVPRNPQHFSFDPELPKNSSFFQEDFYISRKLNGEWQKAEPAVGINTSNNEGAQTLSADGKWMFFTACGRDDGLGSCDIYFSEKTEKGWSEPLNVGQPVSSPFWESQPCFSADGETLYFVSNRPGGKGKNDIWQARIVGWRATGAPIFGSLTNLGDSINTSGDEASPFLHPDGRTLYFSSDGWPGMGKLDIFISRADENGIWQKPKNIGYPINTPHDDNGLIVDATGTTAYYSQEQLLVNGYRKREIMYFDLPTEARPVSVSYIRGVVRDAHNNKPLSAQIELINLGSQQRSATALSSASDGSFVLNLPPECDYALIAQSEGYLIQSENFSLKNVKTDEVVTLDILLSPIAKGEKVTLRNVFFDFDSSELRSESFAELNKLAEIMIKNPYIRVEIGGHTDSDGSAEYNKKLSLGRAQTTMQYVVSQGVDANRLKAVGYGAAQPIATNATEEGKALNRRIEAKIIE